VHHFGLRRRVLRGWRRLLSVRGRHLSTNHRLHGVSLHQLQQRPLRSINGVVELRLVPSRIKVRQFRIAYLQKEPYC
jgi:hypothetical protein